MAGFSLAFGAMFSKTWRVHSIFTDVKLNKKVSSNTYRHWKLPKFKILTIIKGQLTTAVYSKLNNTFQVIKDYQLFMVVGVLLCIDLAIMTTWQVADPFYRETKQMEPYVSFYGSSVRFTIVPTYLCRFVKIIKQ